MKRAASRFAGAPEQKETPDLGDRAKKNKSGDTLKDRLKGKTKEVPAVAAVMIDWSEDSREFSRQFGEWGREALLRTCRDLPAMRMAWALDKLFMRDHAHVGWSAKEIAAWLGIAVRTAEEGLGRVSRMGLVYNADVRQRGPDGRWKTVMTMYRLAMPINYSGPRTVVPSSDKTANHTAGRMSAKIRANAGEKQDRGTGKTKPVRPKTSQENASNETFEKKQQASPEVLSEEEIDFINKNPISHSEIVQLIDDGTVNDEEHGYNILQRRIANHLRVEKGSPRWPAFRAAVKAARWHAKDEETQHRNVPPFTPANIAHELDRMIVSGGRFDLAKRDLFGRDHLEQIARVEVAMAWRAIAQKWAEANPDALHRPVYDAEKEPALLAELVKKVVLTNLHLLSRKAG